MQCMAEHAAADQKQAEAAHALQAKVVSPDLCEQIITAVLDELEFALSATTGCQTQHISSQIA